MDKEETIALHLLCAVIGRRPPIEAKHMDGLDRAMGEAAAAFPRMVELVRKELTVAKTPPEWTPPAVAGKTTF